MPVYRSVPPVSTTSTISSRTAKISVPLLVVSRRNSAKFGDMIKIVSVYIMGLSPITLSGIEPLSYCLSSIFIMFPRITNDRHRSPTIIRLYQQGKKWYAQEVLHLSSLCKELPHSITMLPYKVG